MKKESTRQLLFSVTANDCDWSYTRGTGNGGQKKNKTNSAVHCKHRASGAHWDAEIWKRLLIDQFAHETGLGGSQIVGSIDGSRIVQLGLQSRKFTKEQGSEFIEWLLAWATDKGIQID